AHRGLAGDVAHTKDGNFREPADYHIVRPRGRRPLFRSTVMTNRHALTPTQQIAFDELVRAAVPGQVVVLFGNQGTGRTTILDRLADRLGGTVLGAPALESAVNGHHPLAIEDA